MEQFSLEKWLQDKSRKVVTKTGEEIKIIDTNAPDKNNPIVGYIYHKQEWNGPWTWHIDGVYKHGGDDMDLFFADEEEELTKFEKELEAMIQDIERGDFTDESFSFWKDRLLDLARKEVGKTNTIVDKDKYIRNCDYYYEQGKQDNPTFVTKYVHELQHALKLCGIEKTIEL